MQRAERILSSSILVATAFAGAAAPVGRGCSGHFALSIVPALWTMPVLAPLALWLWRASLIRPRHDASRETLGGIALATSALAILLLGNAGSYYVGQRFARDDLAQARTFAESCVPELDRYRAEHGHFPRELSEVVPASRPLPRLFEHANAVYGAVDDAFWFAIASPSRGVGAVSYESTSRRWATVDAGSP